MTYLASRKRPNYPNVIRFYAITPFWDKETKTQKQKQEYLGSTNGVDYNFHERAQNFADLFKGTPHERAYWNWRGLQQANDNNEAVYSALTRGPIGIGADFSRLTIITKRSILNRM